MLPIIDGFTSVFTEATYSFSAMIHEDGIVNAIAHWILADRTRLVAPFYYGYN